MNSEPIASKSSNYLKRIILTILTILVSVKLISSIASSFERPQIQGKFDLYQTNLILAASEWKPDRDDASLQSLKESLIGKDILKSAVKEYQTALDRNLNGIATIEDKLKKLPRNQASTAEITILEQQLINGAKEQDRIEINLGILQASQDNKEVALSTWKNALEQEEKLSLETTAAALINLWQQPEKFTDAQIVKIQTYLDGWFADRALKQFYTSQPSSDRLAKLNTHIQKVAEKSLWKFATIVTTRVVFGFLGLGLSIYIGIRLCIDIYRRSSSQSISAIVSSKIGYPWSSPWDGETIWQVFLVGFFFVGQFLLPLILSLFVNPAQINTPRLEALYVFGTYAFMAILGISVLYFSIQSYLPLPRDWFNFKPLSNWFLWGFGGYLVANPIVLVVSLINERFWQGQGGSNPLLQIVLESKDNLALALFFLTAAIAAPLFEEILFRGFLLPSLTRYLPVWTSIVVSALVFGVAHLSLSEIVPLTTLGIILGVVYSRTRNLLAPMLLHSLWNSGTLLSLYILGQ
jgi:uncharacterized protein